MSFVKIYDTILDSSIWGETPSTVKVWITMLAMADKNGVVRASVPGLARRAVVTREECEAALSILLAPDPDSMDKMRNPESDGHRIEPVEGGWFLVNHSFYRDLRTDKQVADAERIKRLREEGKYDSRGPVVTDSVAQDATRSNVALDADADADTDVEKESSSSSSDARLRLVLETLGVQGNLSWARLLLGMRQGLGTPRMQAVSWDQLLEAAQELAAEVERTGGHVSPSGFKAFLNRVLSRGDAPPAQVSRKPKGYTLAAGELRTRLLAARVQQTEGPNAGGYYLPAQKWKESFSAAEVRAIEAIGTQRIIDADTKQQGIVLAQLARALEESQQ